MQISYDLTRLLHFLSQSARGALVMNDFRRQQFVLVDGALKLSDVDDAGFDEPTCNSDAQCVLHFSSANFSKRLVWLLWFVVFIEMMMIMIVMVMTVCSSNSNDGNYDNDDNDNSNDDDDDDNDSNSAIRYQGLFFFFFFNIAAHSCTDK